MYSSFSYMQYENDIHVYINNVHTCIVLCTFVSELISTTSLHLSFLFTSDWIGREPRKSWMTLSSASLNTSTNPRSLALLLDRLKCDQHKCELSALQSCPF